MGEILLPEGNAPATPSSGYTAFAVDSNGDLTWEKDNGNTGKIVITADTTLTLATGTFTPGVAFGGGTTGITYSTQQGVYYRIGNVVHFSGYVVLTSKGSSTGNATLTGLPLTPAATPGSYVFTMRWQNMTSSLVEMALFIQASATTAPIIGATAAAASLNSLTDAAFANNSVIYYSGFYFV